MFTFERELLSTQKENAQFKECCSEYCVTNYKVQSELIVLNFFLFMKYKFSYATLDTFIQISFGIYKIMCIVFF